MKGHRGNCKISPHLPLHKERSEYGKEHVYIELLEKHPCSDKEELVKKGNEYIRSLKPSLNLRGYVTCKHNYHREYHQSTKEMVTCECGCVITNRGLKQHVATKKHQSLMV